MGLVAQGTLVNTVSAVCIEFIYLHQSMGRHSYGNEKGAAHINTHAVRGGTCYPLLAFCHPQKCWSFFSPKSKAENSCPNIGYGSAVNGDFHSQRYQVSDK